MTKDRRLGLGKSPSTLTRADYDAYERFLTDPQPRVLSDLSTSETGPSRG